MKYAPSSCLWLWTPFDTRNKRMAVRRYAFAYVFAAMTSSWNSFDTNGKSAFDRHRPNRAMWPTTSNALSDRFWSVDSIAMSCGTVVSAPNAMTSFPIRGLVAFDRPPLDWLGCLVNRTLFSIKTGKLNNKKSVFRLNCVSISKDIDDCAVTFRENKKKTLFHYLGTFQIFIETSWSEVYTYIIDVLPSIHPNWMACVASSCHFWYVVLLVTLFALNGLVHLMDCVVIVGVVDVDDAFVLIDAVAPTSFDSYYPPDNKNPNIDIQ